MPEKISFLINTNIFVIKVLGEWGMGLTKEIKDFEEHWAVNDFTYLVVAYSVLALVCIFQLYLHNISSIYVDVNDKSNCTHPGDNICIE